MEILYLGYACEQKLFELLSKNDPDMSIASHKYELCLIQEFSNISKASCNTDDISLEIISYLPINEIPKENYSKQLFDFPIEYVNCERNKITSLLSGVSCTRKLIKDWLHRTSNKDRIVLTYATNPVLLGAMFSFCHRPSVVTICSEVPTLRIMTNGSKLINMVKKTVFERLNSMMSGYVFMSKHMNTICNKRKKPWIVIEGMTQIKDVYDEPVANICPQSYSIFYAGGLFEEYGIDILLGCAALPENSDIQFIFCGDGNARPIVEQYSQKYKNIQYLGLKKNDDVIRIEKSVTLLINPRKPDNLISRYSFPSKTFEYFASGTPCIISKLDGIPEEYYEHCYVCDVTDALTLSKSIRNVLNISDDERKRKAEGALRFLREQKSAKVQANRIAEFLKEIALNSTTEIGS